IIEVHNGSSLFTGAAGSGSSNLRRYIIERDMLEAIVALPEKMFYNTGIGTYLWIVTNKKDKRRKGTVQLIDATSFKSSLRKSIGEKNCEITDEVRKKIVELLLAYKDADPNFSKVFPNEEFGFYSVDILRPLRLRVNLDENVFLSIKDDTLVAALKKYKSTFGDKFVLDYNAFIVELENLISVRLNKKRLKILRDVLMTVDENAEPVTKEDGTFESDNTLKDNEQIPLTYEGGIEKFFKDEIKPFVPDAWIDKKSVVIGYEITFTKYFYKPIVLRNPSEIISDIQATENTTSDLLADIVEDFKND
ncbi:MAG: N-6 DNA methylase, partial [Selenomonadaceae bacterium]|nr:N-6 DNA methylase [Selenomonadaceae bacterium]